MKNLVFLILFLFPILCFGQSSNTQDTLPKENADSLTIEHSGRLYEWTELEKHPVYPGGDTALLKYLADNLTYPDFELNCILTKIYIEITIDNQGNCINPNILHSSCELPEKYIEGTKSLILNMPKWTPGEREGKTVNVRYVIPVNINVR